MGNQACCDAKPSDPLDSLGGEYNAKAQAQKEAELTARIVARLR
jgi:hypothetical protein